LYRCDWYNHFIADSTEKINKDSARLIQDSDDDLSIPYDKVEEDTDDFDDIGDEIFNEW
jgi:hypothetical protein